MVAAEDCRGCFMRSGKSAHLKSQLIVIATSVMEEGEISGSGLETARPTDWDEMAKVSVKEPS